MSVTTLNGQPTLNISGPGQTALSRLDPLKPLFTKLVSSIPQKVRGHVVAVIGELIGTTVFLFIAFSAAEVALASANDNKGDKLSYETKSISTIQILFIAFGAGISLVVNAWSFFRISGGLFDPAVSISLFFVGAIDFTRCVLLCIAQCAGGIAASAMAYGLYNGGLHTGTTLKPGMSPAQGVIVEMILTCQLCFTVLMLAAEKHEATFLAPLGIGLSVFIGQLAGVFWTGGSMNPARSLGPAVVTMSFPSYHWIYWVGPIAGAGLASIIYKLIKALEYETAQLSEHELHAQPAGDSEKGPGHTGPCECMCFKVAAQGPSPDTSTLQISTIDMARKTSSLAPVKSTAGNSQISATSVEAKKPDVVVKEAAKTEPKADDGFFGEMYAD
ncbi:hypothetical protein DSL72_005574 [Monilinia vaccinii-corymbosi]|uniref:Aquaporin n=1 Tax=Monilinia vaccinii-corymbosi TaxID=61207 RepID=A0A8A3PG23_9HELO|nr:hypothetical protein DSL72_005574 [Monilinia vaccinii-corymbosi]